MTQGGRTDGQTGNYIFYGTNTGPDCQRARFRIIQMIHNMKYILRRFVNDLTTGRTLYK
jgi:hypothetical protein